MLMMRSPRVLIISCWYLLLATLPTYGCVKSNISSVTPKEDGRQALQERKDSQSGKPEIVRLFSEGSAEENLWESFIKNGKY
jgi:hypothetical protein